MLKKYAVLYSVELKLRITSDLFHRFYHIMFPILNPHIPPITMESRSEGQVLHSHPSLLFSGQPSMQYQAVHQPQMQYNGQPQYRFPPCANTQGKSATAV